jgi:tetratricopeptide (TPR) repeat protein
MRRRVVFLLLIVATACAPKATVVPVPVITTPKFPDFVAPSIPPAFAGSRSADRQDRGWKFLQAGDLKTAEREFDLALRLAAEFYPAETSLGYLELARSDAGAALGHFNRTLDTHHGDLSALVGQGQALLALDREKDALASFEAALAVDPSAGDLARRVEVLRFRGQQQGLSRARQAASSGRLDDAIQLYTAAIADSPDSAILYRELGGVERQRGNTESALEHFRKAIALEPPDARSLVQIGEILEGQNDFPGAEKAYADALAAEPDRTVEARLERVRLRAEVARLPEEYRAIPSAMQISRADLAALVGVRLVPLLRAGTPGEAVVITDIRDNWASTWIMSAAQAGVMQPFANHEFQPRAIVRRADLAEVVNRLLAKLAELSPTHPANAWLTARGTFTDLAPSHVAYRAASAAVASGVMTAEANGGFSPARPVSGEEAVEAIGRLETLARPLADTSSR